MALLRSFLGDKGDAVVRGSRYPMRLDEKWSPEPDLLVVRQNRRHLVTPQRLEGPADLVIEIASESDPGLDCREKLPRYKSAGIEEIWLIDPFQSQVLVEQKVETGYTSRMWSNGKLKSQVMRGFWIEVAWLWEKDLPSPLKCLKRI